MVRTLGKSLLELEDVADVGAAPTVDGLVFVADDADVARGAGKQLHQLVLRAVGVLVLVDEQVLVAAIVSFADLGDGLEQAHGLQQKIVEVQRVGLQQFLAIDLEDVRDLLFLWIGGSKKIFLRIDHVALCPRDAAEGDAWLELLVVVAEALERGLDDGLLVHFVVDGEGAGEAGARAATGGGDAQGLDVAAQDAHAEAVEGGEQGFGQRARAEESVDSLGHLGGGLVGEGDGEDGVGADAALLDEVGDAVSDDARLAGAGAGEQQHGAVDGLNAFLLLRIHVVEKAGHWRDSNV